MIVSFSWADANLRIALQEASLVLALEHNSFIGLEILCVDAYLVISPSMQFHQVLA